MLDRRFLSFNLVVLAIANSPADTPAAGTQYIVGSNPAGAFSGATANYIARYNGEAWEFFAPKTGDLEVFNAATSEILRFNGSAWTAVATIAVASGGADVATETHTLTAEEVTAKAFTLSHSIAAGQESNVLLFVSGVAQVPGTDFSASGTSISWNNKGLDSIGLITGDTFIVHYVIA